MPWLLFFSKNFNSVKRGQNSLKEAIELKNSIQSVLKRFTDLRLPNEVKKQLKLAEKNQETTLVEFEDSDNQPGTSRNKSIQNYEELTETELNRRKKREEMLKLAPVVNLDEVEFCLPITQQVETDHRFYGRNENGMNEVKLNFLSSQCKKWCSVLKLTYLVYEDFEKIETITLFHLHKSKF